MRSTLKLKKSTIKFNNILIRTMAKCKTTMNFYKVGLSTAYFWANKGEI